MIAGFAVTVNTSVRVSVPATLVAVSVTLFVPAAAGVPLIVAPEKANPAGRPLAPKVIGAVPLAVMV